MIKSIIKEFIISLLLCLLIGIVMILVFYSYIPMGETIPNIQTYARDTKLDEQLQESVQLNETKVLLTYEIGASELNAYKTNRKYIPGKPNPFAVYTEETLVTDENNTGSTGNNSSNNTTDNTNNNTGSNTTGENYTNGNDQGNK